MKGLVKWGVAFLALAGFFTSCATVSSKLPGLPLTSGAGLQPTAITGIDFRDGEVLCPAGTDPYREDFYAARILTQPSTATKNQA